MIFTKYPNSFFKYYLFKKMFLWKIFEHVFRTRNRRPYSLRLAENIKLSCLSSHDAGYEIFHVKNHHLREKIPGSLLPGSAPLSRLGSNRCWKFSIVRRKKKKWNSPRRPRNNYNSIAFESVIGRFIFIFILFFFLHRKTVRYRLVAVDPLIGNGKEKKKKRV